MKNAMIGGLTALLATGCILAHTASAHTLIPLTNHQSGSITLIGWGDNGQGGGYGGTPQNQTGGSQGGGYGGGQPQNQGGGYGGNNNSGSQGGTYDKNNQGGTYDNNNNQGSYDEDDYPKKKKRKNQGPYNNGGVYQGQDGQGGYGGNNNQGGGYGGNNQGGTQGGNDQGGSAGGNSQGGSPSGPQGGNNGTPSGGTPSGGGTSSSSQKSLCLGKCKNACDTQFVTQPDKNKACSTACIAKCN